MRSCCPAVRSGGAAPMRRTWSQLCSARRWQQCRGVLSVVSGMWNHAQHCMCPSSANCPFDGCSHPEAAAEHADQTQERIILGIESSCDDTGVAVVTSSGRVLGEAIASQADIHAPWGGVVPNLAMEAHKAAIHKTVDDALRQAGLKPSDLDAVAVTVGPGLSLCLRVSSRMMQGGSSMMRPAAEAQAQETDTEAESVAAAHPAALMSASALPAMHALHDAGAVARCTAHASTTAAAWQPHGTINAKTPRACIPLQHAAHQYKPQHLNQAQRSHIAEHSAPSPTPTLTHLHCHLPPRRWAYSRPGSCPLTTSFL
jgi:hypothetical protein